MNTPVPGPAYRIQTPRLVIRCWDPKDAPLLKQAVDDNIDHLLPWMSWARQEPEPLQAKVERLRSVPRKIRSRTGFRIRNLFSG